MTGIIEKINPDQLVELIANSAPAILFVCDKVPPTAAQLVGQVLKSGSLMIEMFHIRPDELAGRHIIDKDQLTELAESKGGLCLVLPLGLGVQPIKLSYLMGPEQESELMELISSAHSGLMSGPAVQPVN